jgi:hypothetical protein
MSFLIYLAGFKELANELAEVLLKLRGEKIRRNNEAAAYFEQLAAAMGKVVEGLRANEVPRISGHEMQTLIHAFAEKTSKVFTDDKSATLKASLEQAAATASTLDGWVLLNVPQDETDRQQMLALLERIIGDCRGLAGVLKSPA